MKTIILGPPGTGKTTTLLNLVDEFIQQGIRPKQIGYFSFTKKAAREAATRASEKFGLDIDTDLLNFRTLHSYAFRMLGMTKEKMMKTEDYKEFGQKCGIPINRSVMDLSFLSKFMVADVMPIPCVWFCMDLTKGFVGSIQ